MKVEAICTNDECPTVREDARRQVQLVTDVHKLRAEGHVAVDKDGNIIECQFCATPMLVERTSHEDAQFPLGEVRVTSGAKFVLAWDRQEHDNVLAWAEPAAELVARHVRGDHGSVTEEILKGNRQKIKEGPLDPIGSIISQFDVNNELLWVMTTGAGTIVMLPGEYKA